MCEQYTEFNQARLPSHHPLALKSFGLSSGSFRRIADILHRAKSSHSFLNNLSPTLSILPIPELIASISTMGTLSVKMWSINTLSIAEAALAATAGLLVCCCQLLDCLMA
jgi:hypothetical protein